eukprot:TRINITY_DN849_c0_g1_i8.p1 TRINITY_DN849_c0_g1~~TRINITY_DN849_c0_g1_i8.p1  ORF type:complete len:240 (-),score=34.86 TRINITY_DN849_c0_g1_i8:74-793(-)
MRVTADCFVLAQHGAGAWAWAPLAARMAHPRCMHAGCSVDDHYLFVAGGYTTVGRYDYIASAELFDTLKGKWAALPSLPKPINAPCACGLEGSRVVVTGGFDGASRHDATRLLDLNVGMWVDLPPMHSRRCGHGAGVAGGRVIVAGGHDGIRRVAAAEALDPREHAWTRLPQMRHARSGTAACGIGDREVVVVGGYDDWSRYHSTTEVWDARAGRWKYAPKLSTPRAEHAVAALPVAFD